MTEVAERTVKAKRCNCCLEILPLDHFEHYPGRGRWPRCIACRAAKAAERQAKRGIVPEPVPAGPVSYRQVGEFTICNSCGHWTRSGARFSCPCPCHPE